MHRTSPWYAGRNLTDKSVTDSEVVTGCVPIGSQCEELRESQDEDVVWKS